MEAVEKLINLTEEFNILLLLFIIYNLNPFVSIHLLSRKIIKQSNRKQSFVGLPQSTYALIEARGLSPKATPCVGPFSLSSCCRGESSSDDDDDEELSSDDLKSTTIAF